MIKEIANTVDIKPSIETGGFGSEMSKSKLDISKPIDFSRPDELGKCSAKNELDIRKEQDYSKEQEKEKDAPFSNYEDRLKHTPNNTEKGSWDGERGESKFSPNDIPENKEVINGLKSKDIDGIEYKNACADFSPLAEETVEIPNMTNDRYGNGGNFEQAYTALADKFNANMKDGKTDWTARDAKDWAKNPSNHDGYTLTIHERNDLKTCDFVQSNIHEFFTHSGGVGEYNAKMKQFNNGGFDE